MAQHEPRRHDDRPLPQTRDELLGAPPRDAPPAQQGAPHGSPEHVAAIDLLGRIEVEIARIERAMDPPLV